MDSTQKYPIGIQTFEKIRREGYVYIDKTRFIHRLAQNTGVYFLSRPRRFGKSLLLSTLDAYFRGRRELFDGLEISKLEHKWEEYPVLHIDMSGAEATDPAKFENYLKLELHRLADEHDVMLTDSNVGVGVMFGQLIMRLYHKTGKGVVVLVDEYDKGIMDVMEDEEALTINQNVLRPFFSQLKAQDEYLRFAFITGVARFRHLTLFSGFNNPNDISMDDEYADICGITNDELLQFMRPGIEQLADTYHYTFRQTLDALHSRYAGYRFSRANVDVYNPFSLLNCLSKRSLRDYWILTGTSKVFVRYLKHSTYYISRLEETWADSTRLSSIFKIDDPIPLLYQTGYLTIGEYDEGFYRMQIPNSEVRTALADDLIPEYMKVTDDELPALHRDIRRAVRDGNVDRLMTIIRTMLATTPYHQLDFRELEKSYHLMIYMIFLLVGIDTQSEIAMSGGRIDMVAKTPDYVYVMEFKLNGSADDALRQIDEHGYSIPWESDGRTIIKIGINFSTETRTIDSWKYTTS